MASIAQHFFLSSKTADLSLFGNGAAATENGNEPGVAFRNDSEEKAVGPSPPSLTMVDYRENLGFLTS